MFDLAIALLLARSGYGEYGKDIFWNVSPVMGSGEVSKEAGIWVNGLPQDVRGDLYTDTLTVSTRYFDPIIQAETLMDIMKYGREDFPKICDLTLEPIVPGFMFTHCDIKPPDAISTDAVDGEGRFVKSIHFNASYKLPRSGDGVWESIAGRRPSID